jgi:hypothetical protein
MKSVIDSREALCVRVSFATKRTLCIDREVKTGSFGAEDALD